MIFHIKKFTSKTSSWPIIIRQSSTFSFRLFKRCKLSKSMASVLEECPRLQEHYELLRDNKPCSTNIEGKSLLDILHEYRCLKRAEKLQPIHRGGIASPWKNLSARRPLREHAISQRACFSEPANRNRTVQTEKTNIVSQANINNNCSQISPIHLFHERYTSGLLEAHISDNTEKLPTLVNRSILFTTSEIRTSDDNIISATPQNGSNPPSYARAPNTNSPRIILSFDRSQLPSLTTPIKEKNWSDELNFTKKKRYYSSKRRLLSESPHPKQITSNDHSLYMTDAMDAVIEEILCNPPLIQKVADNINRFIYSEDPEGSNSSNYPTFSLQDIHDCDDILKKYCRSCIGAYKESNNCNYLQNSGVDNADIIFSSPEPAKSKEIDSNQTVNLLNTPKEIKAVQNQSVAEPHEQACRAATEKKNTLSDLPQPFSSGTLHSSVSNNELETNQSVVPSKPQTEIIPVFTSSNAISQDNQSAVSQNITAVCNSTNPEPMQVEDIDNSTNPKDILDSCMELIQPDTESQSQNASKSSVLVTDNKTTVQDGSTFTSVSIGAQMPANQISVQKSSQQTLPVSHSMTGSNTTMSLVQNSNTGNISLVSNMQNPIYSSFNPTASTLVQIPYSPVSTFIVPPTDNFPIQNNFQYRIMIPPVNSMSWTAIQPAPADVIKSPVAINSTSVKVSDIAQSKKKTGKNKEDKHQKKKKRLHSPKSSLNAAVNEEYPVLSIPEANESDSMSAMDLFSSMTETAHTQSPMLKAMISSAKILAEKGGRLNSTHVRTLDFSSPSHSGEKKGNDQTILKSKHLEACSQK
ncbi:uncharacterized protein CEXT_454681 [Caerostris extrusa]|uniref:Uncharacterized protein n=1 Tax=Caerostris extrusa TaxID=172846 RepID=A0AAV4N740_CAEEX|nr:uncharacterized protein CEXT_454681 [Caerostris extrusa]